MRKITDCTFQKLHFLSPGPRFGCQTWAKALILDTQNSAPGNGNAEFPKSVSIIIPNSEHLLYEVKFSLLNGSDTGWFGRAT